MGSMPNDEKNGSPSDLRPSILEAYCHPLVDKVAEEVDNYFLQNWPFQTDQQRAKFVAQGFSRVTCLYCAKATDDRIAFACKLITITFLTDGKPQQIVD